MGTLESNGRGKVISYNEDISIVKAINSLYLSVMNYCSINREMIKNTHNIVGILTGI